MPPRRRPRRHLLVDEDNRYGNGNLGIGANSHKVDMQRLIGRRMVLHIAWQGAMNVTIHFELDERREKTAFGKSAG